MRLGRGLDHKHDQVQVRELRVFSLENSRLRRDLFGLYSYLKRDCSQMEVSLFPQGTREHALNLLQGTFRLGVRKNFFMERIGKLQNWLLREVVGSLSLQVFK